MRVHKIGSRPFPTSGELSSERRHVRQKLVFLDLSLRPRNDVLDLDTRAEADPAWQVRPVGSGVNHNGVSPPGQSPSQFPDVDVLSAGVNAADAGKWAGVFGDHRNFHSTTPFQ
jgi:hypothetical protein